MQKSNKKFNWKSFGLKILYPHVAIILCLLPISIAFLILSLTYLTPESIIAILTYLLAFYLLLVICFRIPNIIVFFKTFKNKNKYIKKWFTDVHLRMKVSLYFSLFFNVAFAIFQLCLGFYHKSFWYYSMFAYYVILGIMRFFLLNHTSKFKANENEDKEFSKCVICGWLLLIMNVALAVILFFMVYWNKTFYHHMITTISIATFTFVSFTLAIINLVKFKKYNSPLYLSAKSISLIASCVSILTLEATMLTTFGSNNNITFNQIMLSITGVLVIGFAIIMAIIMITSKNRHAKKTAKN